MKKGESPLDFIFDAIDKVKFPLSRTDARAYLSDVYEMKFGIFDHLNGGRDRPLSSIAVHDSERYSEHSYWRSAVRRYFALKVREKTGYSPEEFMALPVNFSRMLLEELERENKQDHEAATKAEDEMRRQLQEAGAGTGTSTKTGRR